MTFAIETHSVVLDGNDFDAVKNTATGQHYFAERVPVLGILKFGFVTQNIEKKMSLADNFVSSPLIIDSIVAITPDGTSDELKINLYRNIGNGDVLEGSMRFSNEQVPVEFPDGIIDPNMTIGVIAKRGNADVTIYVKPVRVLFTAVTTVEPVANF